MEPPRTSHLVQWRTLSEIAKDRDAFADGPFGSNLKTEHYTAVGARVIRLQNIGRGEFLDGNKAFISLEHFASLQRHRVHAGDVVVAALGDGARPAGRACLVPGGLGEAVVKADCFRVRVPREVIRPEYLVSYLNSPQSLAAIASLLRGATRPRVTLKMLRELRVPVLATEAQDAVVTTLREQFEAVTTARRAAEERLRAISALPAALLRAAFPQDV